MRADRSSVELRNRQSSGMGSSAPILGVHSSPDNKAGWSGLASSRIGASAMIRRLGIPALFTVLFLSLSGLYATRAGTIQDILSSGGSLTQGNLKFTFTDK